MNNQINNAAVYIIDSEFRILYFNQVLKKCYPELRIGELCFASICAESHPCPGCPLVSGRTEGTIFYNKCLRKWVEVNTARFDTVDDKDCKIILAREIKEDNRNLFYNLTNLSTYDELFELNLTNDSYKILYHMDGKYVIPAPEGRLEAMIQEVVAGMIYPCLLYTSFSPSMTDMPMSLDGFRGNRIRQSSGTVIWIRFPGGNWMSGTPILRFP